MLSRQTKQDIYGLLCHGFMKNVEYPLAKVALYLKSQGLNYKEFGYTKMKSLLEDSKEFLTLKTDHRIGHEKDVVILHDFNLAGKTTMKSNNEKQVFDMTKKDEIYNIFLGSFDQNIRYPMAKVSKELLDKGIDYKGLGFSKMKTLLTSLPFISLESNKNGTICSDFVIFHKKEDVKPTPKKAPAKKKTIDKTAVPPEKKAPIAESKPKSFTFYVPPQLVLSIKEMMGIGLDSASIVDIIRKDYEGAIKESTFEKKDDAFVFPLSIKNKNGEDLICSLKKSNPGKEYDYYVNFIGADKEKPRDFLKNHLYFSDYKGAIEQLANLAIKEEWCYHHSSDPFIILEIYLQYTFYRLVSENKVMEDKNSGFVVFNTGLVNNDFDGIFCVMMKNSDPKIKEEYLFQGFTNAGSQGLGKIIVENFSPLPPKAQYFTKTSDFVYDINAELHTDYQHIIKDNISRFPLRLLKTVCLSDKNASSLINSIQKERREYALNRLYANLEEIIENNPMLFTFLKASLETAIQLGLKIIRYNRHMALPSFFPTRNVMSMMLPLIFDKNIGVEDVLLVELTPSGNYQGQTILTLKQCYVNSRLIGPLENTYLNPRYIED